MNKDLTLLVLLIDSSGSMTSIKDDMEGSIKTLLEEQAKLPGECRLSVVTFDTQILSESYNVLIGDSRPVRISPRGGTALHDATCYTIDKIGSMLANKLEYERPGRVIFVSVTDGQENSSVNHSEEDVRRRIKHQEEKYSWKFIFLGANQDAVASGSNLGFARSASMTYSANTAGVTGAFRGVNIMVSGMRMMTHDSYVTTGVCFSDEDRKNAVAL